MVQIGVSILSADPSKSDVAPAREWAMKLVEEHSGLPFSDKDRDSLLHHPLDLAAEAKAIWSKEPMVLLKCEGFRKKPDGSWEEKGDRLPIDRDYIDKYLDTFCDGPWMRLFKTG
jgi:hypothetical protein